ncbi:MAG: GTP-binding protein [Chlamydiales bacterium]|jgi:GTP-binding protein
MFVDRVKFKLSAGKGGNGVVSWRREKYIRKGGPAGGDGGIGGSIILQATTNEHSLESYRNRRHLKAENGAQGGSSQKKGRNGKDLIIKIPCGTLVKEIESGEILYDFTEDGEEWIICPGGKGGKGNINFATPTNRAPNYCTEGKEGEVKEVELELKLIADVGLVGFPNAGKSTLISSVAKVNVKIAPYPFTTLRPNLGYIDFEDYTRVLMADIPGLIKGAHENKGLGYEFLRHVERTKVLVFILDASGIDGRTPAEDFRVLREELAAYNEEMAEKPFIVLLNKIDTEESQENITEFKKDYPFDPSTLLEISALEKLGLAAFLSFLHKTFTFNKVQPQSVAYPFADAKGFVA